MKPSKFFYKKRIENQRWYDSDEANESTIKELDLKYIDKEELKEKIIKLWKSEFMGKELIIVDERLREILKLLEE